ncbi:MAG: hypothetical protein ABL986_13945 [Vicinamibacterales bacterium]
MTSQSPRLLVAARELLQRPDPRTAGMWPRASALLARQALEGALDELWRRRAPGLERCSMRAQLLCLPAYLGDDDLAARVSYAWAGLSRACHQHVYELPPVATELAAWLDAVERLVAVVTASLKKD